MAHGLATVKQANGEKEAAFQTRSQRPVCMDRGSDAVILTTQYEYGVPENQRFNR